MINHKFARMMFYFLLCIFISYCGPKAEPIGKGKASFYADFFQDRITASGEVYDSNLLTAAHREIPFGKWVIVRRVDSGESVKVKINDRGPFNMTREIDLSKAAAKRLNMIKEGVVMVELELLK